MISCVFGFDDTVADFVAQLIPGCQRGFGKCRAIGVIDEDGKLIGGMVYHKFDPEAGVMEISSASTTPRWMTRNTLAVLYQYPFLECGCQMVVLRVDAENERLLRQLAVIGHAFIRVPRLRGRDRDGIICTLTAEDWMSNKFNRRYAHHLAAIAPMQEAA